MTGTLVVKELNKETSEPFLAKCSISIPSENIKPKTLIWSANQLIGFYMMGILVVKGLSTETSKPI